MSSGHIFAQMPLSWIVNQRYCYINNRTVKQYYKLKHSLSKNYDIILRKAKFVDFGDIA